SGRIEAPLLVPGRCTTSGEGDTVYADPGHAPVSARERQDPIYSYPNGLPEYRLRVQLTRSKVQAPARSGTRRTSMSVQGNAVQFAAALVTALAPALVLAQASDDAPPRRLSRELEALNPPVPDDLVVPEERR